MSSQVSCPGSSTMTDDGKACTIKLDIPLLTVIDGNTTSIFEYLEKL